VSILFLGQKVIVPLNDFHILMFVMEMWCFLGSENLLSECYLNSMAYKELGNS
jgi:hypothetical protein